MLFYSLICYLCSVKHHWKTYLGLFFLLALLASCGGKRMRQRLQFVADYNSADTVFTKEWQPTVDSLVDYFSSYGTANERMTAYYLKGRVHHDLGEAPQALDAYQRATEQADTTRDDCDLRTLYSVYGQMADLFEAQYLPDNEMRALQIAERIAWKNRDTLAAIKAYELRVRPYFLKAEKDSMLLVMQEAHRQYLQIGHRKEAAQAIYSSISILLDRNQIQETRQYLDLYEKESGNFDENGDLIFGGHYYYDKGRYLLAVGQIDSARYYFHKALSRNQKEAGYYGLLSVYEKKNIADSIAKYAKLFASANDSSFLHVNQEKVHQITAMYDYTRHQQMAEKAEEKARIRKYVIINILVIVFLMVTLSYARYRRYQKLKIAEINRLTTNYQLAQAHSQHLKDDLAVLEGIKKSNEEMMQSKQSQIDYLNAIIQRYEEQLQLLKTDEKFKALKQCDVVEHFYQKKQHTLNYSTPSNQDWKNLKAVFVKYVPLFIAEISKDNRLSEQEQRVCLLESLGFSTGEMAVVLDTTSQVVTNAKSSANQKLFSQNKASTLGKNLKKDLLV